MLPGGSRTLAEVQRDFPVVTFSTSMAAERPYRLLLIAFGQDLPGPCIDDIVRVAAFAGRVKQLIIDVPASAWRAMVMRKLSRSPYAASASSRAMCKACSTARPRDFG